MSIEINRMAVIGTGTLGAQIAALSAARGYEVRAYDPDETAFDRSFGQVEASMKNFQRGSLMDLEEWKKGAELVDRVKTMEEALGEADLVIEAATEDLKVKRELFARMDALAPARAILATNSSSMPVSHMEDATGRPEKCLNLHFYNPARGAPMVDVMGGSRTGDDIVAAGVAWVRSLGCVPLRVKKESLGFCFNRVWRAIKRETLHMWADGYVDFQDVDRAWMLFSGMPIGPFGMMDGVGLDVVRDIELVYYHESQDQRDYPPQVLNDMIERGELGLKSGRGFYSYPDPEYNQPDFFLGKD